MYAFVLLAQLTLPPLPEPLSLEPTLATQCQCLPGQACQCGDSCDCHPTAKSTLVTVRKPRIDATSPITLAPDPDYDDAIAAFTERWKDPTRKIYVGKTLPPEPAAVGAKAKTPTVTQPSAKEGSAVPANTRTSAGPLKTQPPINQAAMVRQLVCRNGVCQYEYVPAAAAPTKSVQTYQRRGLLGRWRGR